MLFVRLSIFLLAACSAYAETEPPAYREFRQACTTAFAQSQGQPDSSDPSVAKEFCVCVTQESKSQKVTLKALKQETARIQKDPKAQIQDSRLLAAFHYCTMEVFRQGK
ncbi:hypothetical protein WDW86_16180 [Bdellovibrionota bacterium FG-2]